MQIQPYLSFEGRCEEAVEFYRTALGAEVQMMMRFKDSPEPATAPAGSENKIMHVSMRIGDSIVLASDGYCKGEPNFSGIALSITAGDVAAADRTFAALSEGGKVHMPLAQTFWSPRFGMVSDRFGVMWMVGVAH